MPTLDRTPPSPPPNPRRLGIHVPSNGYTAQSLFQHYTNLCCCHEGRGITRRPSFSDAKSPPARVASRSMLESGSRSNIHEALANYRSGAEMSAPTSRRQTGDGDRPKIHPMPPNPLSLLTKLTAFIKVRVMSPWPACVQHPTTLLNLEMSILLQEHHPYTGNLNIEKVWGQ